MERCTEDCDCLGVVYTVLGNGLCFQKGRPEGPRRMYNGMQSGDINNVALIKVSDSDATVPSGRNFSLAGMFVTNVNASNKFSTVVHTDVQYKTRGISARVAILITVVLNLITSAVVVAATWLYFHRRLKRRIMSAGMEVDGAAMIRFSYHQLEVATNFFDEKLGEGGFGTVYKGVLSTGAHVAVKSLEIATQAEKQFQAEVMTLGKIHHINLVRLLGYCAEGSHRLLVYEYMPNGSLEKVLFSQVEDQVTQHYEEAGVLQHESQSINTVGRLCDHWKTRFSIILGIARGITYLHEECRECILHCDIKPQNILLDADFCPKVADFGLAKLMQREGELSITTIRGTRGYIAPEWISKLAITPKVDVYSFGMMLLEIMSGRDKYRFTTSALESGNWFFPDWALQKYVDGDLQSIADPKIVETVEWRQFKMVLKVCIQSDASSRPSMSKVVQMLEENVQVLEPPKLPDDTSRMFQER